MLQCDLWPLWVWWLDSTANLLEFDCIHDSLYSLVFAISFLCLSWKEVISALCDRKHPLRLHCWVENWRIPTVAQNNHFVVQSVSVYPSMSTSHTLQLIRTLSSLVLNRQCAADKIPAFIVVFIFLKWWFLMQCSLRAQRSCTFSCGFHSWPFCTDVSVESLNLFTVLCTVDCASHVLHLGHNGPGTPGCISSGSGKLYQKLCRNQDGDRNGVVIHFM